MSAYNAGIPSKVTIVTWVAIIAAVVKLIIGRYRDVMQLPALNRPISPIDPDPWLRLTQIRQLLTDGSFFEHIVRNTNAPYGGISTPWTRPLDMLIVFFTRFTPAELPIDTRLLVATAWLGPVLGVLALFLLAAGARRYFNHTHALWCLVLLAAVNPWTLYFDPGNADHHGLLTMLWCGVLCGLARPLTPKSGVFTGMALGTMLWISPESLLLIGAVYALAGVEALRKPEQSLPLALMTLSAAAVVWAGLFVEMPPALVLKQITYDSLSLPHAVVMTLIASGAGLLWFVRGAEMKLRLQSVVASATVMLLTMACWFPKFFKGPLVDVDPFIKAEFLPHVTEARPLHEQLAPAILLYGWMPLLALLMWRKKRLIPYALTAFTALMMIYSTRWAYYAQPPALLLLATTLPAWCARAKPFFIRWTREVPRLFRPYLFLIPVIVIVYVIAAKMPQGPARDGCGVESRYILQSGQLQRAIGKKPLTVFVWSDFSGQMLFFTPHRIIAGNYHREGVGLRDLKAISDEKDAAAARKKLAERKVDAIFICPTLYPETSWMHGLSGKAHPKWLEYVSGLEFMNAKGPKPELFLVKD